MATTTARVSERTSLESKRIAALRGQSQSDVLDEAWSDFLKNNRDQFAEDLERAAKIVRDGTTAELAEFINRDAESEAAAAAARMRSKS